MFLFVPIRESDLPTLADWLDRPHVRRWFGEPAEWLEEIASNLESEWIQHFRADLEGVPAGFVQCYETSLAPAGPWSALPAGTLGLDFLLASPELLGRGLGARLVREFVAHCTARFGPRPWAADPDPENVASIRALRSCGFEWDPAAGLMLLESASEGAR